METLGNQIMPELCHKFYCNICDYRTSKKSSYDNHKLSAKHQKGIKANVLETFGNEIKQKICSTKYTCEKCSKEFKNRKDNCMIFNNLSLYTIPKQNVSSSIINLIKKMLECDPAFRLSSAELWSLLGSCANKV